ncbi:mercuric ion transport protein [Meinhardsimonia xiamenensis]|jgi:mercuric ion transport protein|uniref:Mercuric transport protein MerT n=1 Tax=Meinhardsimonia xiamenensis TaxID=990712 RepID=A0A1G8XVC8_9RHOB|nr:mercuric ion transport protein [Meinhardsimonia xiamenensis]SDJ93730.1 mercuric ion transport protein [Meinhardsimonia xiamenensis]
MSSGDELHARSDEGGETGVRLAAAGGIAGALAMTSCCVLPLVAFSLGASGAWIGRMGALYPYKWYFFAFAGASLAYGFWKLYRPARPACADGRCTRPLNRGVMKAALWTASGLTLLAVFFPYLSPWLIGY